MDPRGVGRPGTAVVSVWVCSALCERHAVWTATVGRCEEEVPAAVVHTASPSFLGAALRPLRSLRLCERNSPSCLAFATFLFRLLSPLHALCCQPSCGRSEPRRHGDTEEEEHGDFPDQPCRPVPADLGNGSWFGEHGSRGPGSVTSGKTERCWSSNRAFRETEAEARGMRAEGGAVGSLRYSVFSGEAERPWGADLTEN